MRSRIAAIRRAGKWVCCFVMIVALATLGGARASAQRTQPAYANHPVGIVNASFGLAEETCGLEGWAVSGNVTSVPLLFRADCKAVLTASNVGNRHQNARASSIEQSFVVNGPNPVVRVFINLGSRKPQAELTPQTITLYDQSNQIIAQATHRTPGYAMFERYLPDHIGQTVRLNVTVATEPVNVSSPNTIWMEVDFRVLESGLANEFFGQMDQCMLDNWTVSGDVSMATTRENGNCYAILSAKRPRGRANQRVLASISQTFAVDPTAPLLELYLQPFSDKPGGDFPAQTITLVDGNRNVIYHKANNLQVPADDYNYLIELDLTDYANQSLTLEVTVQIDPSVRQSPDTVTLRVDSQGIYDLNGPGLPPGGVW
ncbi:MAG TPA: hypothetical protein VD886_17165 [Herpetosiphonaceae bacterium]|nr:hypothetical protein [Herpetosiphonaceae bacterium]